jgi:acyl carrier protein
LSENTSIHDELKELIVDTLALEDITAAQIETDAPLFVEGLGLDSIDSLEIAMVLEERYGVALDDDPDTNRKIFDSVRSLGVFVTENRER